MYILELVFSVLVLSLVKSSVGYPDGAPERACFFMIPRHTHPQSNRPIFKQTGGSPYNISLSSLTYVPNRPIRGKPSMDIANLNVFTSEWCFICLYRKCSQHNADYLLPYNLNYISCEQTTLDYKLLFYFYFGSKHNTYACPCLMKSCRVTLSDVHCFARLL